MALASGESRVLTGPLTMHTQVRMLWKLHECTFYCVCILVGACCRLQTALHFARVLTGAKIEVEDLDGGGLEGGRNLIR